MVLGDSGLSCLRGTCKYVRCEREKNRKGNHRGQRRHNEGIMGAEHQERRDVRSLEGREEYIWHPADSGDLFFLACPVLMISRQCRQPNLGRAGSSETSEMKVKGPPPPLLQISHLDREKC